MFANEWNILLVDDEPDVLSISKLAMRNFTVYGMPLNIHTAANKTEAIEQLRTGLMREGGYLNLAVAFIDVVMETDTAGLELCEYIREDLKDKFTVLYIRTGQPGIAPEREVIDRYDISGYFTKIEATEDKLYSLVKSGVRQYYSSGAMFGMSETVHRLIAASGSREGMAQTMNAITSAHQVDATGEKFEGASYKNWVITDGHVISGGAGGDEAEALELQAGLDQLPGTSLSEGGDKWVTEGSDVLIKVAESPESAEFYQVMKCSFPPPDFTVYTCYRFLKSFATLWHKAA